MRTTWKPPHRSVGTVRIVPSTSQMRDRRGRRSGTPTRSIRSIGPVGPMPLPARSVAGWVGIWVISALQPSKDRRHPSMLLSGRREIEFQEDVADVLLHGLVTHHELAGDRRVGAAL